MSTFLFADLYKPHADFFTKNYNSVPLRVEAKATGTDSTFTPIVEQLPIEKKGALVTSVEYEQKIPFSTFSTGYAKVLINSSNQVKPELKLKEFSAVDGVEIGGGYTFSLQDSRNDSMNLKAEYKRASNGANINATIPSTGTAVVEASYCGKVQQKDDKGVPKSTFLIGGRGTYTKGTVSSYAAGVSYRWGANTLSAQYESTTLLKLGFLRACKPKETLPLLVGVEGVIGPGSRDVNVGVQSSIKGTVFKTKTGTNGVIGCSAQSKISQYVTVTISAEYILKSLGLQKAGVKFMWEN